MACLRPLTAYQAPEVLGPSQRLDVDFETGEFSRSAGTRPLSFVPQVGWSALAVPCGKCDGCLLADARTWAIRAHHEASLHDQSCFVTLTFDDEHLPSDGKISKRDLQLFFKRLRKRSDIPDIRYLACGEYGDLTRRPHYHALIFGADFMDARARLWRDDQYLHPVLNEVWGQGLATHAPLNFARCAYVAGYVTKKIGDPDVFRLMSRGRDGNGGLGFGWIKKYADSIRRLGGVVIDGVLLPVPSYYVDKADLFSVKQEYKARALSSESRLVDSRRHRATHAARSVNVSQRAKKRRGEL